jgi:hypothetical protein
MNRMSTSSIDELLRKWTQGSLTPEQAIGHMLQHLKRLDDGQRDLDRRLVSAVAYVFPSGPEGSDERKRKR